MIAVPPFESPSLHIRLICVPEVYTLLLRRSTGGSGVVKMIAPFPASEVSELPKSLTANTLAYTLAPQGMRYGAAFRVATEIVH